MCGLGCRASKEVARRSGEYDFSAVRAAARPHVDDPIRLCDKFKAMFDDDDRVAVIDEAAEEREERGEVFVVEPGRGFVHHIDLPRAAARLARAL